jgi:exodeoxyribonuclease VII large subunit
MNLRLKLAHPGLRLTQQQQRLGNLEQRLGRAIGGELDSARTRFSEMSTRLVHESPEHSIREYRMRHDALYGRLGHAIKQRVSRAEHRLGLATRTLNTVSPLATLGRGFALVKRVADGALVTNADSVAVGDEIEARLAHGTLKARVTAKE